MSRPTRGPTMQIILEYLEGQLDEGRRSIFESKMKRDVLLARRVDLVRGLLNQPVGDDEAGRAASGTERAIAGRCSSDFTIVRYSYGGLVASAAERLELHLALCDRCRARLLQATDAAQALGLSSERGVTPSDGVATGHAVGLRHDPRARDPSGDSCAGANRLAVMLYAAGDREGALDRLDQALEHDPTRPVALYNHGRLLAELGFSKLAARSLLAYLKVTGGDAGEDLFRLQAREILERISPDGHTA